MSGWRHSGRSNALLSVAIGLVVIGLLAVGVYAFSALAVMGQPDQSMLFWLLPFLFVGLASVGVGVVLAVLWLLLVNTDRASREYDADDAPGSRGD